MKAAKRPKAGTLVFLKNVGTPYKDFEGASGIVVDPNAGNDRQYVSVRILGEKKKDSPEYLFHPTSVIKENRPWLRKRIRAIVKGRSALLMASQRLLELAEQCNED